jgi:hypothetical protein
MRGRDSGTENEIMNFDIWSMIHVNHHLEIESCNVVDRSVERAMRRDAQASTGTTKSRRR